MARLSGRSGGATRARLGANRWHFQHGPIELIIEADADADAAACDASARDAAACDAAFEACWSRFQVVLPSLVAELPALRRAAQGHPGVAGPIALRMLAACAPFARERFITPMAAVAGAVADDLIGVFARRGVRRAFINNGGDIALLLTPGAEYRAGIWSGQLQPNGPLDARFSVAHASPVRGVATSGWRGRSQSLGIADSVTVLACSAAAADAAATLIANAVNSDSPGIVRAPAVDVKDDSDLGERLVTVDVPPLPAAAIAGALALGRAEAERWRDRGLLHAAALFLQGRVEVVLPRARAAAMAAPAMAVA